MYGLGKSIPLLKSILLLVPPALYPYTYNLVFRKLSAFSSHDYFHHLKAVTNNLIFWIWQYRQFPSFSSLLFARLLKLQLRYIILIQICCNLFYSCPETEFSKFILQQTKPVVKVGEFSRQPYSLRITTFAPLTPLRGLSLATKYSQLNSFTILSSGPSSNEEKSPFATHFFRLHYCQRVFSEQSSPRLTCRTALLPLPHPISWITNLSLFKTRNY